MRRKANRTLIGSFIAGGIALAVLSVIVLGSGRFLGKRAKYILCFPGSVKGLNVGSPVMFRGVSIGSVTDIMLRFDPGDLSVQIPVIIEIDLNRITRGGGLPDPEKYLDTLIEKGLRGQLQMQSIVTGQLMVNFDFYPDKPVRLLGVKIKSEYPELPTVPSGLEELTRRFEELPFDEIFTKLAQTLDNIDRLAGNVDGLVRSPDVKDGIVSLNSTLRETREFVRDLKAKIAAAEESFRMTSGSVRESAESFGKASESARHTLDEAKKALAFEDGVSGALAADLRETLRQTRGVLVRMEKALSSLQDIASGDSPTVYELNNTLKELSSAARSVRFLAEYLDRHPEAVIRGKQ